MSKFQCCTYGDFLDFTQHEKNGILYDFVISALGILSGIYVWKDKSCSSYGDVEQIYIFELT